MFTTEEPSPHRSSYARFRIILLTTTFVIIVQLHRPLSSISTGVMKTTTTTASNNNSIFLDISLENKKHETSNNNISARAVTTTTNDNRTTFPEFSLQIQPQERSNNETSASAVQQVSLRLDQLLIETTPLESFPRWDKERGIALPPLLRFMKGVLNQTESAIYQMGPEKDDTKLVLSSSPSTNNVFHAETIYVVDADGVHASATTRSRTSHAQLRYRVTPTERILVRAWQLLMVYGKNGSNTKPPQRWKRLHKAILEQGGFPWVAWYGDNRRCFAPNNNGSSAVPIFTVAAQAWCTHTFPTPTYKTIAESKRYASDWNTTMAGWMLRYQQKIPKVVWRGGLTGMLENWTNLRWRMVTKANENEESRRLFDVAFTDVPPRHNNYSENITAKIIREGLWAHTKVSPMENFQQYAAILDADGNSWSSRFGSLLCYNSVVLKVNPQYVDYFHFSRVAENVPRPWVHYVPVRYDLSDLHERAAWVLDPAQKGNASQIVANANAWCQRQMNWPALARDYLDIWQAYVEYLDVADPLWYERDGVWKSAKQNMFAPQVGYDMITFKR